MLSAPPQARRWLRPLGLAGMVFGAAVVVCASQVVCIGALTDGIVIDECPDGGVVKRISVEANDLQRGESGRVNVWVDGWYTTGRADLVQTAAVRIQDVQLALIEASGNRTQLTLSEPWRKTLGVWSNDVAFPQTTPDGDHELEITVQTPGETLTRRVAAPLYAPTRIAALTDRPIYEQGQTVLARAVTVRAADQLPVGTRAGVWTLRSPTGEVVVERKDETDAWGVAATRLQLGTEADSGRWTVEWRTGDDIGAVNIVVEPFTLPRWSINTASQQPWYEAGEAPSVLGVATYASGAPVAGVELSLSWSFEGLWRPPTHWTQGELPASVRTRADGTFAVSMPPIPEDLVGQVDVTLRYSGVDPSGESIVGRTQVRLAQDQISVQALSELGDGLVGGYNNRLYLRATTPDGQVLRDTELTLRRLWDASDQGVTATTDSDGVAAIQLDPGPPVSVEIPTAPQRPEPRPPVVTRQSATLVDGSPPRVADVQSLGAMETALAGCAELVRDEVSTSLTLRINQFGQVEDRLSAQTDLGRCVAAAASVAWTQGERRTLKAKWRLRRPDRPTVVLATHGAPAIDPALNKALEAAALRAGRCLPQDTPGGPTGLRFEWRTWPDKWAQIQMTTDQATVRLPMRTRACVATTIASAAQGLVPTLDAMGTGSVRIQPAPTNAPAPKPQPQVMTGYAFAVSASRAGEELGSTTLQMPTGSIPPLRLRADPALPGPGDVVEVSVLRGPDFSEPLPEQLSLTQPGHSPIVADLDATTRRARFTLPSDAGGWFTAELYGARTIIWIADQSALSVELKTDQAVYAPGEPAVLEVQTTKDGAGVPASVGLFGVDQRLAQVAPLPDEDALDGLYPQLSTTSPAFGLLETQALVRGAIRGPNAAAAVLLRTGDLPSAATTTGTININAPAEFDPVPALTDSFHNILTELHRQVREWEASAPATEHLQPATLAQLWEQAQTACAGRGEPATDAFGRPIRLRDLPDDLLAMTEPRVLVSDGTRMPEDIENWSLWVQENQP